MSPLSPCHLSLANRPGTFPCDPAYFLLDILQYGIDLHQETAMSLPRSVQEIADVIGRERALYLVGQLPQCYFRDTRYPNAKSSHVILYVPTLERLKPDHELVRILGWTDATVMCKAFGGEILKPANCIGIYREFRDQNIVRIVREGVPISMVAEWFDVSDRHVKNLVREIPQEERRAANDQNTTTATKWPKRRKSDEPTAAAQRQ